jgi:hypothetical protein
MNMNEYEYVSPCNFALGLNIILSTLNVSSIFKLRELSKIPHVKMQFHMDFPTPNGIH